MPPHPASSRPAQPRLVSVLLPLPLDESYDYLTGEGLESLAPGDFVRVPLGSRTLTGVVWGEGEGRIEARRLKAVTARLDVPPLPEVSRRFVDWVAAYTLSPAGAVLRMAMSVREALEPPPRRTAYRAGGPLPERLTPARRRVLELLAEGPPRQVGEIATEAAVSPGVVSGLAKAGALIPVEVAVDRPYREPDPARPGATLSPDQAGAAEALRRAVADTYSATLLEGVTGAGKTEVYFEAIAAALTYGRQVLVLVPEIALTAQWLERFQQRFGAAPAEWHSDLTQSERRRCWRAVAAGRARVVVGARSALFLPFPELGLIVVDEEHDPSFKQEEGVIYNARDMAVARASLGGVPVVLVSATPSLETVVNAEAGRYARLHLPERHGIARLPEVEAVDLRRLPPEPGHWLSPPLHRALAETIEAGEQAMLFLNRRGYAPLTLCRACGHRMECPNCSAWLVEHRFTGELQCHHCGFARSRPDECPKCHAEDSLVACGPGVERVAEEVERRLPGLRLAIMTSDTLASPRATRDLIDRIQAHQVDLLIGTQVMAKGHHFPLLTLVGVVDADLGLAGGDLRAAERTFQLLSQVAGRAGRGERPGRALLQTYMPEHPVMAALLAGDREGFIARESEARRAAGMPPFGRLVALIVSGPDEGAVHDVARELGRKAPRSREVSVLGPAPAPLSLLRGRHRQRLLLKAARRVQVQPLVRRWLARVRPPASVRIQVDVDPYSFL